MAPHSGERRPPAWQDRSVLLRSSALAAGLALALVGCGAVMPGANGRRGGRGLAGRPRCHRRVRQGRVRRRRPRRRAEAAPASRPRRVGDQEAQVQALEDWVNANGGIGGRKLDAVFRLYDAPTDSPAAEEQLCNQITQDDKAFAVVLTGQYQTNARPCYAERQTLVLDALAATRRAATTERAARRTCGRRASPSTARSSAPRRRARRAGLLRGRATGSASSPPTRRSTGASIENLAVPAAEGRSASSPRSPGSTPPTPARSSRASTQARDHLPQQGHRPGDVPRWLADGARSSRPSPGSQDGFTPALRDLELRQPDRSS